MPGQKPKNTTPLLFVPSLINRWYVLDMTNETSMINKLTPSADCYLIDWGYPGAESGHLPMSHFYHKTIKRAVRQIKRETKAEKVNLLGYCIGGTMAYIYSCLEPEDVKNLVLLTAPLDFEETGILGAYSLDFPSKEVADAMDYMPGWLLAYSFDFIQPLGSINKMKMLYKKSDDKNFLSLFNSMERWISDQVHYPVKAYDELITDFYKENKLAKGLLLTNDKQKVNPENRIARTFIVNAEKDHIAPVISTKIPENKKNNVKNNVTEKTYPTGHIGITVGRWGKTVSSDINSFLYPVTEKQELVN
jgi:polyhydroxyalkanoate synthase